MSSLHRDEVEEGEAVRELHGHADADDIQFASGQLEGVIVRSVDPGESGETDESETGAGQSAAAASGDRPRRAADGELGRQSKMGLAASAAEARNGTAAGSGVN